MKIATLEDLYIHELKDLYSAEKQILKALPKMVKKASSDELRSAFQEHLEVTEKHVERLDKIFEALGKSPRGHKCEAMEGLLKEGSDFMNEDVEEAVLDAGMIAAAQKVEHYEMSGYGTCRTFANLLGYGEQAQLLQETLDEEGEADKKLTELAESEINVEATAEGGMGEEE